MAKFKKGISGILAFILLCSTFVVMAVPASAAETTEIAKGEGVSYAFNAVTNTAYNSSVALPQATEAETSSVTEYNSDDGKVSMTNEVSFACKETSNVHGLLFSGSGTISFKVAGDATINLGLCQYNETKNQNITVTDTSSILNETFSADATSEPETKTIDYTGEATTITITVPGGVYIHSLAVNVKSDPVNLTPMGSGETKSYNFVGNTEYNTTIAAGTEKLSPDGLLKFTAGDGSTISYNGSHGLQFSGSNATISFIVPGDATINYGGCMFTEGDSLTATASVGTITPDTYSIKGSDRGGTITENQLLEFAYIGEQATITLTFPNNSYIHTLSVVTKAPAGDGTSFKYWLDGGNSETASVAKNLSVTQPGGTVKIYGDLTKTQTPLEVDGESHATYNNSTKGNGTETTEPTDSDAIGFVPSNNGVLTIYYNGLDVGKNLYVYSGKDNSFSLKKEPNKGTQYTMEVNNGTTYFFQTTDTSKLAFAGLKFLVDEPVSVGITTDGAAALGDSDEITFTDVDSGKVQATYTKDKQNITLLKGHTYSILSVNPAIDAKIEDKTTVTIDDSHLSLTITLTDVPSVKLTGAITSEDNGIAVGEVTKLTFKSLINPTYSVDATITDLTYEVTEIKPGNYETIAECSDTAYKTSDHVSVVAGKDNTNEVYFYNPDKTIPSTDKLEITVGTEDGADYKTLKEAIAAVKGNTSRGNQTVTFTLNSDLEEQVDLDISNVKIKGNNHNLTWYYAYGAQFYSCGSNGYYNEVLYRDAYSRNPAKGDFWGGVLIIHGNNVVVEDLTIKNTFNYTVTDKAAKDGIIADKANQEGEWETINAGDDVTQYNYKERANAVAPFGDNIEFYNCQILSSQDGLGINGENEESSVYFRDCKIGGNVDYICGGGTMLFDNCELEWYIMQGNTGSAYGYITAPKVNPYIFRNCIITKSDKDYSNLNTEANAKQSGFFGRCWGGVDAKAYFINTETNGTINVVGWGNMSNTDPAQATFIEYANTINGEAMPVTTKGNKGGEIKDDVLVSAVAPYLDDVQVIKALGDWTPEHYTRSIVDETAEVKAVVDDSDNLIVYSTISKDKLLKATEIGFMLSIVDDKPNKDKLTDENVYKTIKYTKDSEVQELTPANEDDYLFAFVVNNFNSTNIESAENLYARIIHKNTVNNAVVDDSLDDVTLGPVTTISISTLQLKEN